MSRFTEKTRSLRVALASGLAGGATLAGEVLGARLIRPLVGSTSAAQAGSVAGVLGGLGLGAWLASRSLSRDEAPARALLTRVLLALAALTVLAPVAANAMVSPCARALVSLFERSSTLGAIVQALATVILTLPFGVLAGATFPCLAALHGRGAGRATAVVGAASSLGSAAVALLAVFVFAPALGVRDTLWGSVALTLAAAAMAQTFANDGEISREKETREAKLDRDDARVLVALGLTGFASTAWQLTLTRLGALAFGASAFALGAATASYVAALALGEGAAARPVENTKSPERALRVVLFVSSVAALLVASVAWKLPGWSASVFTSGSRSMASIWGAALLATFALGVPVVAPLAAAIPLAARSLASRGDNRARANGRTLGAMAAGNVLGALVGALWALPRVGLHGMFFVCAASLALGALCVVRARPPWPALAALAIALVPAARKWDPGALLTGPFLYAGAEDVVLGQLTRVTYGREATVAVRRDDTGAALLQIDGKVDATSAGDASTQLLVGVVPAVLCAHPREVLVVGLGSGMTVDAVRDVPGVSRVDVTELLPEVVAAGRDEFRAANHAVLSAPGVRVIEQDASLYLRGTRKHYDVIVSQPSNPWVAGMADLFTREALSAARERLNPGGVMAAWFHAYSTDAATFASVLATFYSVFPSAALVEVVPGQDYMVAGMVDPVRVDVDRVVSALASPALAAQLTRAGVHDRGGFFGRFVAGTEGIAAMVDGAEVLHANDLRLEFRAPSLLYNDASADIFALLARAQDLPLAGLSPTGSAMAAVTDESEPLREAMGHVRQMVLARESGDIDLGIRQGEQAVAASPEDRGVRAQLAHLYLKRAGRRYRRRDPGGAGEDLLDVLELDAGPAENFRARAVLGDLALARNDFETAARQYGAALEVARATGAPTPELHVRMAQVLISLGDVAHARAEMDRAIRESPDGPRRDEMEVLRAQLR